MTFFVEVFRIIFDFRVWRRTFFTVLDRFWRFKSSLEQSLFIFVLVLLLSTLQEILLLV
jgi:hypothetical protein